MRSLAPTFESRSDAKELSKPLSLTVSTVLMTSIVASVTAISISYETCLFNTTAANGRAAASRFIVTRSIEVVQAIYDALA